MTHDLELIDALDRLTVIDSTDRGVSRRQLLGRGLGLAGALTAAGVLNPFERLAAFGATAPRAVTQPARLLLLIQLAGGCDGLNTLVPMTGTYGNLYRQYRGPVAVTNPIALADPKTKAATGMGLHPNLTYTASQWAAGKVAIAQGIGYPNPSLSHFDGIATWMKGSAVAGTATTGWIGRWLDTLAAPSPFQVVQVSQSVPLHMIGAKRRGVCVGHNESGFGTSTDASDQLMYTSLGGFSSAPSSLGAYGDLVAGATATAMQLNKKIKPLYGAPSALPQPELEHRTRLAARLFNANFGVQVVSTMHSDFDEHDDENSRHPTLMADIDAALSGFFRELDPVLAPVTTVMFFTEFGRKPWANASGGTDHGTANMLMMMGAKVKGGLYGAPADISNLQAWQDPTATGDFRSVYQNVLTNVLATNAAAILGGTYPALNMVSA